MFCVCTQVIDVLCVHRLHVYCVCTWVINVLWMYIGDTYALCFIDDTCVQTNGDNSVPELISFTNASHRQAFTKV